LLSAFWSARGLGVPTTRTQRRFIGSLLRLHLPPCLPEIVSSQSIPLPALLVQNRRNAHAAHLQATTTSALRVIVTVLSGLVFLLLLRADQALAQGLPNLTPYQPAGWSDKIVVSNTTGMTVDSPVLKTTDTLYVSWAIVNNGTAATNARFYIRLFLDGAAKASWYADPPLLQPNYYLYVTDYSLGSLSAGSHTLRLLADATGSIVESNEFDNEAAKTITVAAASCYTLTALPNLTAGGSVSIERPSNCSLSAASEFSATSCATAPDSKSAIVSNQEASLSQSRNLALSQAFERLISKAATQGRMRVIVGLALPLKSNSTQEGSDLQAQRLAVEPVQERFLRDMSAYDLGSVKRLHYSPFIGIGVDESSLRFLQTLPDIMSIEEDIPIPPALAESTPLIGATAAWAAGHSGAGQVVAILDIGVDKTHPFLAGKVISEACYSTNDPQLQSVSLCPGGADNSTAPNSGMNCAGCYHGTHVAGIAAGRGTTFSGVARDAQIIAIQVFSQIKSEAVCGQGKAPCTMAWTSDELRGLERVLDLSSSLNIAAANMSLGSTKKYTGACDSESSAMATVIAQLRTKGIATIIASGNSGYTDGISFPACISGAISVGSTEDGSLGTVADTVSDYSNSSAALDLLAPGRWIYSSVPGGSFLNLAGTSMATPHVAGAWAVLKSKYPSASVDQVLSALASTGRPITDWRNSIIKPRIQIDAALNVLGGTQSGQYSAGTIVTLSAAPNPGYRVQGWNGCDSFSGNSCTVTMNSNKTVTAVFAAITTSPPTILTANITSVASTSALANATVNANGSSTRVYVQWGTTTAYGYTSTSQFIGSSTSAISLSVPIGGLAPDTTYYCQVAAESASGTTSLAISPFKTSPDMTPLPDLVVASLKSSNTGVPGEQIPIELVIQNAGPGDAGTFRAGFYLSIDNVIDTSDIDTGWVCNYDSGLKAGSSGTCSGSISIPAALSLGIYLLGVIADNRTELVESNRQNNTRTADTGPLEITAADSSRAQVAISVADGGAASFSTLGTSDHPQTGYATANNIYGVSPYSTAVYSLVQNGVVVTEAGVPASPPTKQARVFIDYRPNVLTGTPPNTSAISVSTGIALANQGNATASLTFQLKDVSGNPIASIGHGMLAAGAHTAKFVSELNQIASDFTFPTTFSGFGLLDIISDQPVSIVALRLTTNQRNETLLTTTPIADLTAQLRYQAIYLPQLADGGGYKTLITLLNTSDSLESGQVAFVGNDGAPLNVRTEGASASSGPTFPYRLSPGGVFTLQTEGSPAGVHVGSVQIIPDSSNAVPVGAAVFSYSVGGILVTESGVSATLPTTHARIYVDGSKGHDTGLAIAGAGSGPTVSLAAYLADGVTPAGAGPTISLAANGHVAAFAYQFITDLPADFIGVLDISASQPFAALALRSLVNSRNDFLMTTFPIADFTRPAPSPIVFPQIADGGGYTTQFIFLSPGGSLASTIKLFDDSGKPLRVYKQTGQSDRVF